MDSLISSPANPNLNSNHGPRASSIPQEVHLNPGLATEASRAYHGPHQHSYPGATQQLESWAQGSGVNTHARIDVHPLVRHLPIQTASEHARRPNANTLGAQARSNSGYTAVHASAGFYPGFTAVQASTPSHIFLPPSVPASRSARHRNETIAQAMAAPPAAFSAPISSAPRVVSASEYARRQPSPIQPSPMPYFLTPAPPYEALPSYDDVAPPMPPVSFTPVIEEDGHTAESGENEARPENGDGEANQEDEENQEEVEIGLLSPIAINVSALPQ
ncbi:hypothetical protein SCP_0500460 [Sparassis crispa]|uniref:Uncharacterized protein n=1 Tax=Sparassis crispa TaxID=139825 RepID=A0A401GLE7_9APHY|nr:hypothetical protein SCP_0500460 [Sparassis crispa]GBE83003.1 hypothetical protein SCP_0500460 [Sparassis crispa]